MLNKIVDSEYFEFIIFILFIIIILLLSKGCSIIERKNCEEQQGTYIQNYFGSGANKCIFNGVKK